jgi:thiamine-phosphate pyrophosphorylase
MRESNLGAAPRTESATAEADKQGCRLYLVTPPALEPEAFARELEAALGAGDVACLQLRLKNASDDAVRRAAQVLMPVCHDHDVAFILNDRPDLAAELGTDGVHVGQDDADYFTARAAVGSGAIVGVTCHDSKHLAYEAAEQGADYVAFGAFFATTTKPSDYRPGLDLLRDWSMSMTVPCVAIGGITAENCAPLVAAGADFLAVVTAVWNHPKGPGAAVAAFNDIITRTKRAG